MTLMSPKCIINKQYFFDEEQRMKEDTVCVQVEHEVKKEAEAILQKLGVPVSVLINSLYREIIYRKEIPFSLSSPENSNGVNKSGKEKAYVTLQDSQGQPINAVGRSLNEILADLEQAEERANKEGWFSADDAEKLLED